MKYKNTRTVNVNAKDHNGNHQRSQQSLNVMRNHGGNPSLPSVITVIAHEYAAVSCNVKNKSMSKRSDT